MPPRSVTKKQAPLPSMFKAAAEKTNPENLDFDLIEKPVTKKSARIPQHAAAEEPKGAAFVRLDDLKNELNSRLAIMSKEIDRSLRDEFSVFLGSSCDSIGKKAGEHLEILNESIKSSQIAQNQISENHLQAMRTIKAAYEEETNKAAEKDEEVIELVHKVGAAAKTEAQGLYTKYINTRY